MNYENKYKELVELSHSDNPEIKQKADAWLIGIGLQAAAELKVSAFLLDLVIKNVKGELSSDEMSQRLKDHYGDVVYHEPRVGLDGGYEVVPPDSPRIKEIKEYNRNVLPLRQT
ncbi:antitoxin VbhA family protein [Bacteroides acidifaciens]|uniref:antitoxin VbhA family protein n=1 Tax=Bacteroides acidifaciens TaxID=85831 RepID=UPI002612067F|nr:antitoxin VbhA family protein [Bacteroides acidifaciens]